MQILIWIGLIVVAATFLAYRGSSLTTWTVAIALALGVNQYFGTGLPVWALAALAGAGLLLNVRPLRRQLLGRPFLAWFKSILPPMSATEKEAIDAGTIWWDAELFSGRPDWRKLRNTPAPAFTDEEQAYLDGPVETLCAMLDDWQINHELNDLPPDVWQFLRDERFFGMIIPKRYGGLEFSPRAQSEVVMKVATRSAAAGITVMVPNSLGPGELLLQYGTDQQRDYYLPRLARGEEIPAFALTSPAAGSDAGSMPDTGVVCNGEFNGQEVLGFRVNWSKRYITLGPVCTVLGLAFKAVDPDGLLGSERNLGITCALIPTDTPGVTIGSRHAPGAAFQIGPNSGTDVFVPMDWVIGGQPQVGAGWKMLMSCLSIGRAISLPAFGVAGAKLASRTTGAYARIRKQFGQPVGRFEGVEEALARIGGLTYRMDSARSLTAIAINEGEKPAVLGAILKYHNTEGLRQVIGDAMDVHAGRGVCDGPRNYLQGFYRATPVSITVEGANILTRSMIIFGQGAIRCHPYVLDEMAAASDPDAQAGLRRFDELLFRHIGHTITNAVRALVMGLTGARLVTAPVSGPMARYYQHLSRISAAFAFIADAALLSLGGDLKRRERLSARLGDILSHMYMASAILKRFEDDGSPESDRPFAEWGLQDSIYKAQDSLESFLLNFPARWLARLLRWVAMPLGRFCNPPSDRLGHDVASLMLAPSESRDRLTTGMFIPVKDTDPIAALENALKLQPDIEAIEEKVSRYRREKGLRIPASKAFQVALEAGIIDNLDVTRFRKYEQLVAEVIRVDEFFPRKPAEATAAVSGP